jgi:hypothetical protein
VVIAIFLAIEMTDMLVGRAPCPRRSPRSARLWRDPTASSGSSTCARCTSARTRLLVAAKIAVAHIDTARDVARTSTTRSSRSARRTARYIFLEPDLYRSSP